MRLADSKKYVFLVLGLVALAASYTAIAWALGFGVSLTLAPLSVEVEGGPLSPKNQVVVKATIGSPGKSVSVELIDKAKGVKARLSSTSSRGRSVRAVLEAEEGTEAGWVTVRVYDASAQDCNFKDTKIQVSSGCPSCDATSCSLGGGRAGLGCIDFAINLGTAVDGRAAGYLLLQAEEPSPLLATPQGLLAAPQSSSVEVITIDDGPVRQVVAPQSIVDVVVTSPISYEVRFYKPSDALYAGCRDCDNLYAIKPDAVPLSTWRIENPDPSGNTYDRLRMTEMRGSSANTHEYRWDAQTRQWSLDSGEGLKKETRQEVLDPVAKTKTVTRIVTDKDGKVASAVRTVFQEFPWGESLVEKVADPEGDRLATLYSYYEDPALVGSYGRLKAEVNPDGSWARHEYDADGRLVRKVLPWLDAPVDAEPGAARQIIQDYAPVDAMDAQEPEYFSNPRMVQEVVLGQTVGLTFFAYLVDGNGNSVEVVEQASTPSAAYGDPANSRTVTVRYPLSADNRLAGKMLEQRHPDGRVDTYTYESGVWTKNANPAASSFTPGAGSDQRTTVTHGTAAAPAGVALKTTRQTTIHDNLGHTLFEETSVFTSSGYERIGWVSYELDDLGRVVKTIDSTGKVREKTWDCCGAESETDEQGIRTTYTYDSLRRVEAKTREGVDAGEFPGQSAVTTSYTYNAEGRVLTETTAAADLSLTTANRYDAAGRLREKTDASGLVTRFDFSAGGGVETVTLPGGATRITTRFLDGQMKSLTGTGVVQEFHTYGVNPDGGRWSEVRKARSDSPMFEKTTADLLGRPVRTEVPAFGGGTQGTESVYDGAGRLVKTRSTGMADTLMEYDALGNPVRSGLDVDGNGALDLVGSDRITEADTVYKKIDGAWWQEAVQKVYATTGSATPTIVGAKRSRLTGLGANGLVTETVMTDIHGNTTVQKAFIDRAAKKLIQITDVPDSITDETAVSVNGRPVAATSKTGVTNTFLYDSLGRRTGVTDPRTGTTVTHYNGKNQVDWVADPAGNKTRYEYDASSGRKTAEINALGNAVRTGYNSRGEVIRTWGEATYPVSYEYDAYGRREFMYTYRGGTNWEAAAWPSATTGQGDATHWVYDEATGLLVTKLDAVGKGPTYTYTANGKLATRTWARKDSAGRPLVTTYTNDPKTGELLAIDYSDATPDVTFTYDRLGRKQTVTDAVGLRTFTYNSTLQLEAENITGLQEAVITRKYQTAGMKGRDAGFTLGSDYEVTYGYDASGRFSAIGWNVNGQTDAATYTYAPNSDLLSGLITASGQKTSYGYEAKRNNRSMVRNEFGDRLISKYDYVYDTIGRRTSALNTGEAFSDKGPGFNLYGYNSKSEVTESSRYLGTDLFNLTTPVPEQYRSYDYDNIGNREEANDWDNDTNHELHHTYTSNKLNQYDKITTTNGAVTIGALSYDADGNITSITKNDKTTKYVFDSENRMVEVMPLVDVEGDTRVVFDYDYMGRRFLKQVYDHETTSWLDGGKLYFYYDDWNIIRKNKVENFTTESFFFVWGLDLSQSVYGAGGIGGLLSTNDGSGQNCYSYFYDGNGNVSNFINSFHYYSYEYDINGKTTMKPLNTQFINNFLFATKYYDEEYFQYMFGFRYYSAEFFWEKRDPLYYNILQLTNTDNPYNFLHNSPINYYEKNGLTPIPNIPFVPPMNYNCSMQDISDRIYDKCNDWFCVTGTTINDIYGGVLATAGIDHVDITYKRRVVYVGMGGGKSRNSQYYTYTNSEYPLHLKNSGNFKFGSSAGCPCKSASDNQILDCLEKRERTPGFNCQGDVSSAIDDCCLAGFSTIVSKAFPRCAGAIN